MECLACLFIMPDILICDRNCDISRVLAVRTEKFFIIDSVLPFVILSRMYRQWHMNCVVIVGFFLYFFFLSCNARHWQTVYLFIFPSCTYYALVNFRMLRLVVFFKSRDELLLLSIVASKIFSPSLFLFGARGNTSPGKMTWLHHKGGNLNRAWVKFLGPWDRCSLHGVRGESLVIVHGLFGMNCKAQIPNEEKENRSDPPQYTSDFKKLNGEIRKTERIMRTRNRRKDSLRFLNGQHFHVWIFFLLPLLNVLLFLLSREWATVYKLRGTTEWVEAFLLNRVNRCVLFVYR